MNSITIYATLPTVTVEEEICSFWHELPSGQKEAPAKILVKCWGKQAALCNASPGKSVMITGTIRVNKGQPSELHVTKIDAPSVISLVGRAGRDPSVRYLESGSVVANLTIAVNRRSRDDEPDWFNLEIWGKQAQVAADYVRKGSLLGVTGSLKVDRWTDRTSGEEQTKPVIQVDRLDLLGSRRDSQQQDISDKPANTNTWGGAASGGAL